MEIGNEMQYYEIGTNSVLIYEDGSTWSTLISFKIIGSGKLWFPLPPSEVLSRSPKRQRWWYAMDTSLLMKTKGLIRDIFLSVGIQITKIQLIRIFSVSYIKVKLVPGSHLKTTDWFVMGERTRLKILYIVAPCDTKHLVTCRSCPLPLLWIYSTPFSSLKA